MSLNEIVNQAWAKHESDTERVALELEKSVELVTAEDAGGASALMNLVNHAIGDHLRQRDRALSICEAVIERLGDGEEVGPWFQLAVASSLAGNQSRTQAAQARLGGDEAVQIRVQLLVAQGRGNGGEWPEAATVYGAAISAADALGEGHGAERAVAIVSNNLASALVELPERELAQEELMLSAANNARRYWLRVGDWINDERADYLLAMVFNVLGRPQDSQRHVERALNTIAEHGNQPVDEAFLLLALAQAHGLSGAREEREVALERAKALAISFETDELRAWFDTELAKVVSAGGD